MTKFVDLRRLRDLVFEPDGDGYRYYRSRWSGGVPVTAAERDEYLNSSNLGAPSGFHAKIKDRPKGGRRDPRLMTARWAAAMPLPLFLTAAGVGLLSALSARDQVSRWLRIGAVGMMLLLVLFVVLIRVSSTRKNRL